MLLFFLLLGGTPVVDRELDRGAQAFERGDLTQALVHWSTALAESRDARDAASELEALHRLASAHRRLGRLGTASELLILAEKGARTPAERARVLADRGLVAEAGGAHEQAASLLEDAFRGYREGEDPAGAATAALNLGRVRLELGRVEEAERALVGAEELFGTLGDVQGRADALYARARLDRRRGRLTEARNGSREALLLYQQVGSESGEADALGLRAVILQDLGRFDEARHLYEQALATARERREVERQAALLSQLANLSVLSGDPASAVGSYRAAEEAYLRKGNEAEAVGVALNLALVRGAEPDALREVMRRAQAARARRVEAMAALNVAALEPSVESLDRAAELAESLQLGSLGWRVRYLRGQDALSRGRTEEGLAELRGAVEELERTRRGLGAHDAVQFVLGYEQVYQTLIDTLLARGEAAEAFTYAQRFQLTDLPAPPPGDVSSARLAALGSEEATLSEALAGEIDLHGDSERARALREQLAALRVRFAATVDELRATHPDFDQVVRMDPEDLEAVQAQLDPDVVVVQPLLFPDRLVLLVVGRTRLEAVSVEVERDTVVSLVRRLVRVMQAANTRDRALVDALAERLGDWLWAPVAAEVDGAEVVVVSASGPLRELPFSLLRQGGRYLAEVAAVASVTHVGSLGPRPPEERLRLHSEDLLLVGNPDGTLPGAEEEVAQIRTLFPTSEVITGHAATPEALYARVQGKVALHLATHGIIDPDRPNRSYLVVAGDPGRVGYGEIPGLAPWLSTCRLVVLSACESGRPVAATLSDDGAAGVSINGLAAQFRRAGVETLVGSLWRVDDAGTRTLMRSFYGELSDGTDVARALQRAQQRLLADPAWSHPFYWSAFVVVGDWR